MDRYISQRPNVFVCDEDDDDDDRIGSEIEAKRHYFTRHYFDSRPKSKYKLPGNEAKMIITHHIFLRIKSPQSFIFMYIPR